MPPIGRITIKHKGITVNRTNVHSDARHHPGLKQNLSSFLKHTAPPNKQKTVLEYVNFRDLVAKEAEIRLVLRLWLYLLLPISVALILCSGSSGRISGPLVLC
jgi:hypothetical protein